MKPAVVLMAYGSPSDLADIRPYLEDIRSGRPVSDEAVEELTERYRRIGGRSPLDDVTEGTRAGLERELGFPVYAGMKHWTPRIAEAVDLALENGADSIVGLVLAPHYSKLSIDGYRERLEDALDGRAGLRFIESWHVHEPYLDVLAERVRGTDAHVVFTAHSLPARILDMGDPYRDQLLGDVAADRGAGRAWSRGRSPSRARARPASRGSGRTSSRSSTTSTSVASSACSSARSGSSPTTSRSCGTSTSRLASGPPSSGSSSTASSR